MPQPRPSRRSADMAGHGRAAGRNERLGGNNRRPTALTGPIERVAWDLTPGGRVLLADVAADAGVDRRNSLALARACGIDPVPERIPGRPGPAAPTVTPAQADYLAALHDAARERIEAVAYA